MENSDEYRCLITQITELSKNEFHKLITQEPPPSVKWAHHIDDLRSTGEGWPLLQDTSAGFAGISVRENMDSEPTEH